ncbi:cadmium resistance transporter [Nostoc sp. MS1]|uniref:cadmium resistance transporter n=1 Tax=Nostoc sp. MS1 TaxID=2764711 RepID=UPI001CC568D5|nr:cadmium resistance transporter [Nostoc sp. MS1]BCL34030.1 quaternary ammonium transporter [Nostoc sp. MS1]
MSGLVSAISTGVFAFSATNIDDLFILTLFFSQVNAQFRRWHIIAGQYLGFSALVLASIPGFFGGLILPRPWIGLFGLLPIAIGIKCWLDRGTDDSPTPQNQFLNLQIYSVAAITFANGTDNISIYVPLFASSSWESLVVILGVFFTFVGLLCFLAYQLTNQSAIADLLTRYGNQFMPFVLIGLGVFIVLDSGSLTLINLLNAEISPLF